MPSRVGVSSPSPTGANSAEGGVPIGGIRIVDNFPGYGSNPGLTVTWDAIVRASDLDRFRCVPDFGTGHTGSILPIPYIPPAWWDDLPPMPAPRGVNPEKWAKLGLKAQFQLWALGRAFASPQLNVGISVNIPFVAADVGAMVGNPQIVDEVARLTNKLIGDIEYGQSFGQGVLDIAPGSSDAYAAGIAYAGCQFYRELRFNSPALSQEAFDLAKRMAQGLAEGSPQFATTRDGINLTKWGLFGVQAAYSGDPGLTCQSKVFGNRSAVDFHMREEDLFASGDGGGGGGGGGGPPYVPPEPCLYTDSFGRCIELEPQRARLVP